MNLRIKDIAAMCNCSPNSIRVYICRSEFSNIKKIGLTYYGVTEENIETIKELMKNRKEKPYGGCYSYE